MERREFIKSIMQSYEDSTGAFADETGNPNIEPALLSTATQKPYCFTQVFVKIDGAYQNGKGFSKVCYPDEFDAEVGVGLSRTRAVRDLASNLWVQEFTQDNLLTLMAME